MPTFVASPKMNPALAARVEASVRGRPGQPRSAGRARRLTSLARFLLVVAVAYGTYGVFASRRQSQRELEEARTSLLALAGDAAASFTPEDHQALARIDAWLTRLAGDYEGDVVDEALRRGAGSALAAALDRGAVYVRGPLSAFGGSADAVAGAAAISTKDALLLCLAEPPSSRKEAALFEKARAAYAGGSVLEQRTANVRRLHEAIVGLPFVDPAWDATVRGAESAAEVARLRLQFERAPIERARQAAKAKVLLAALDEPGDGKGPAELDGERPHVIRLALVDLGAAKVLLRLRLAVDPSWISAARRPTYASGLDSCALAFDVGERVRAGR